MAELVGSGGYERGKGGNVQAVSAGSRPSSTMPSSPKADEIQVGERMKQVSWAPSTFCRLGMIWMALEPLPMTPIRLLRKS